MAKHELMDRVVALKVISPKILHEPQARELFLREVIATTKLLHPNIAFAYDAGEIDGILFFVMEYVPGISVQQYVLEKGTMPIPLACNVAAQTALALQYAHEKGMVHRDIKPANLILAPALTRDNEQGIPAAPFQVKVIDFGLARLHPRGTEHSHTLCTGGGIVGTPAFMAPEQARDVHGVDIRADLYSLGCTLYFVLSGVVPFEGSTTMEMIAFTLDREPIPLQTLRPDLPPWLLQIVQKLMAKDPAQRFQTPGEAAEAFSFSAISSLLKTRPEPREGAVASRLARTVKSPSPNAAPASVASLSMVQTLGPNEQTPADTDQAPLAPALLVKPVAELWLAWCAVVEQCAARKPVAMSPRDYRLLQRSLVNAAANSVPNDDAQTAANLDRLKSIVEPWVSLDSIASLDAKMLADLQRSCRNATTLLSSPRRTTSRAYRAIAASLVLAGVAGALFFFVPGIGGDLRAYAAKIARSTSRVDSR
jgi:hypothetical protein